MHHNSQCVKHIYEKNREGNKNYNSSVGPKALGVVSVSLFFQSFGIHYFHSLKNRGSKHEQTIHKRRYLTSKQI